METAGSGPHLRDVERMLAIRVFEERLPELSAAGRGPGTTHPCRGREYVPVALLDLVPDADVFSDHRGHGRYLARYDDPHGLLAEILGKDEGVCRGVGGSHHLYRPGFMSAGVRGSGVPVAAGAALSRKQRGTGGLSVCFVGDGTWGEGVVYETLDIAARWNLPLLLAVEHAGAARPGPAAPAGSIAARAAAFGVDHLLIEGCDVGAVRARLAAPVERVRSGRPLVVEFRSAADWYAVYDVAGDAAFSAAEHRQRARMDRVVDEVLALEPSAWEHCG
ncbi:thiamine pyrophosphate-dependent enzyme [Streptomyces lavendulae]|uniref:thiamine pyrophosphate-dependent enzyme n=1 Tax=Streptomyces TaxID=1883 RepID=UPI002475F5FE|nr:thiamine pyrophosphate-dependent enzyme [Streptomyces sp. SPB4]MDH6540159.1 TPP-dependent pyruvate/acetoin dehydrogenase alpha subunit [Streptomyces sp. SPB4]